jgi:MFS transporter, ACS family, hexuronate transporter
MITPPTTPASQSAAATSRRSPDEWSLIVILALCAGMVFLNRGGIAFLFPMIKPELHLNNVQLGQLMAVTSLSWAVSSVFGSVISDALGIKPRTLLVICALGFSAVGALAGAVSSFTALLALRLAMGVFEGPVIPLIQSTMVGISPAARRGANLGFIIGGSSLIGAVLAPPMTTGLGGEMGWRFAFLAIAAPGPLIAFAIWFVMRSGRLAPPAGAERLDLKSALRLAMRRNVMLGMIGAITLIGGTVTFTAFFPIFMTSLHAFTGSTRVLVMMAMGVGGVIGGMVTPALSDRLGRKTCLIAACVSTAAAPVALVLMISSPAWIVAAIFFHMVAAGALTLAVYVIPGETVPPQMAASTFAVLLCVGEIVGGATAPTAAGWMADHYCLPAALLVCTGLGAIALLAALCVHDTSRRGRTDAHAAEPIAAWSESTI